MNARAPRAVLGDLDRPLLDEDPSVIVALDPAWTILWTNAAWGRFAAENEGAEIARRFGPGASYLAGVSGELRDYYERAFRRAFTTGEPFVQDYECSSPGVYRRVRMRALPLGDGLLLEHARLVEHPHDAPPSPAIEARYRSAHGLVSQCSNCRRVRRVDDGSWDWVPAWVARPPHATSHGICPSCFGFYWGPHLR